MTAVENTAKIEMLGGLLRWVTPVLMGIVVFYLNSMNNTLTTIQTEVGKNRIGVIKLEANQDAFWSAFNNYRHIDESRLNLLTEEVDEVNTEVDEAFEKMHRLDIQMREYRNHDQ